MADRATAYARDVLGGDEPAGQLVHRACQRHLSDLARADFYYNAALAERAINFFPLLRHYKGEYAGQPLTLAPFQEFIVGSLFGWYRADGKRRYNYAYIEVPRKNGKTTWAAGVAALAFILDQEPGVEIYTVATKEDQAKLLWRDANTMMSGCKAISKRIRSLHNTIEYPALNGIFKPLGADSKTLDGLNPHLAIGDEFHAWPQRGLYDVIDSAFGARQNWLYLLITTAGHNIHSPCYQHRQHIVNVLNGWQEGGYVADNTFGFISTIDEGDDPFDESVWRKANPLLGSGKQIEYMRTQAEQAQQVPSKKNDFLTKQLNVWVQSSQAWLRMDRWANCAGEIREPDLVGKRCYTGLDLASNIDFAAYVHVFPPQKGLDKWHFLPRLYLPEAALGDAQRIRDRAILDMLRRWRDEGHLRTTPGDWIEYAVIREDILADSAQFRIVELGFDPHNAGEIPQQLALHDIECVAVSQGFGSMGNPTKELERLVLAEQLSHPNNPCFTWQAGNVAVATDNYGNIRPDKRKCAEKIDGAVAAIIALQRALANKESGPSVYEDRGILVI